jgi:multiple sugar transport system substrate-binding protein
LSEQGKAKITRRKYLKYAGGAVAAAVVAAAGYGVYEATKPPPTIPGVTTTATTAVPATVTVAPPVVLRAISVEGPRFSKCLNIMGGKYTQEVRPNVTLEVEGVPWSAYYDKFTLELASQAGHYDIIQMDYVRLPCHAPYGQLYDLTNLIYDPDPNIGIAYPEDFGPQWKSYEYEGKLYGVPVDTSCGSGFYRKDLVEKEGVPVPNTWDELYKYAKEVTKEVKPGVMQYGFAGGWLRGTFLDMFWTGISRSYGVESLDENMKPHYSSPESVKCLKFMGKLQEVAPPGLLDMAESDVYDLLGNVGNVVFDPLECSNPGVTDPNTSKMWNQIGGMLVPGGPKGLRTPALGGLGLVIPNSAPNKEEAWKFIRWIADPSNKYAYVDATGQPGRISWLSDPKNIEKRPYFEYFSKNLAMAVPWTPPIKEFSQIQEMRSIEQANYLTGAKTAETAMRDLDEAITALLEKAGYYTQGTKRWWSEWNANPPEFAHTEPYTSVY